MTASSRAETQSRRPRDVLPGASGSPAPPSTSTPPAAPSSGSSSCSPPSRARRVTALWLFFAALFIDGTDGMLGPPFPGQGDDPLVRRRPPGQHRRLPDLRLRAGRPALDHRLTCRTAPLGWVLAALPLLASSYQFCRVDANDRRRPLLPRLPELLERRRLLRDRPRRSPTGRPPSRCVVSPCLVFVPIRYLYPSPHDDPADADAGAQRRLGGHLRRAAGAVPRPAPRRRGGVARLPRLLRRR